MKIIALLTIVTIGLLGLLVPSDVPPRVLDERPLLGGELQRTIEANRASVSAPKDIEVEDILYRYANLADEEIVSQITRTDDGPKRNVSLAEAREDVVFLFQMFKYGYVMYEAFGGDEAFGQARTAILNALEESASGDVVRVKDLKELILHHLGFIQDGHARFAGVPLYQRDRWFRNDRYEFLKDDAGYYVAKKPFSLRSLFAGTDERIYLTSIDDGSPEEHLVLSLSAEGELVHILSRLSSQETSRLSVQAALATDRWTVERTITLYRQSGSPLQEALRRTLFDPSVTYDLRHEGEIPIVVNRSTIPAPVSAVEALKRFIADAASIGESPVAILDLRNHSGGQAEYPLEWAKAFTGQEFTRDRLWMELQTRVSLRLHRYFAQWYYTGNPDRAAIAEAYFDEKIAYVDTDPEAVEHVWQATSRLARQTDLRPNDTTLFVLIDAETGSAGEEFVEILRLFENVILVGENSEGLTVSGSPGWGTLPHSQLPFTVNIGMSVGDVLADREGIGATPDIWVDSRLALDRVVKYIQSRR